ncbi:MAG TPA: hypothetical protein PKW95_22530 [bacterium]|nr:hypothetical protein [bacterium]
MVCEHRYLRSVPPPVAMYAIIQGEPSHTPTPPNVPENCIPLAYCFLPASAVRYTDILNFITHFKYNCEWDDEADAWRIVFGAKMALLVSITPSSAPYMNASPGLRVFVHAGGVPDGSVITWTRVMELTPQGFTELVALAQEVIAARGSMASLDARLDVSLGENGAYKRVGFLDQVMAEVEQARGSAASLDTRLDVSLNNDGSYRRVGLLDQVMDEVEDARGSMPDLDARLDVSLNNDGTIKTAALQEKIAHADLTNMPDTGGTNGDHDARYYRQTEINDMRDRIHGDGVLTGCDVLSVNGMSLHIAAGTVLLNGKLVTVGDQWSDSMETEGTWYCSINSLGNSVMSQSGWNGVHLYKCRASSSDVEVVSDKRDMISLPDRRNIFRHAQDFYDTGVTMLGGVSMAWEGVLAIGKVAGCGTTTYDGQTRGYCRMVDATFAAVFEPDMIVTFWNLSEAATYKRVVHAVNADYVYFTTSTSVGANSSGTLAEYRKIDSSADFRDRILTVLSTSRYSLYNDPNFMPNGNDKGTWGATAGGTAYGNFRMNVSQVYTELGIDFSQTGWSDQETGSGAAMVYVPGGSQDSGSQGWRILADDYDGDLWIAYAHATWDGIFDASTYKGGRANFYVMILASPDLGGYV